MYRFFLKLHHFFLFFCLCLTAITTSPKKAVVVVPIADLVGNPLATSDAVFSYNDIPLAAGSPKQARACPRSHQLLFNEVVETIAEQNGEVQVSIPTVYYLIPSCSKPQTIYWTQKQNLISFEELTQKGLNLNYIPQPIDFNTTPPAQPSTNTITLLFPWVDPITKQLFSAGTRFVLTEKQQQKDYYSIYLFDPASFSFKSTSIPKNISLRFTDLHTNNERINLFVQILRKWANCHNGFIPYVWGGCSFINVYDKDIITKHELNGTGLSYFVREGVHSVPKNGFDCSGLIARAAQLCGIPYFFKNTTTIAAKLPSLQKEEDLHEGDLIWIPGHVMVVANIPRNTIIEARGYGSGYGKVHELPLNKLFKDVGTYADLLKAYFANKPLNLLTKGQEISSTITTYKILKLAHVWNKTAC